MTTKSDPFIGIDPKDKDGQKVRDLIRRMKKAYTQYRDNGNQKSVISYE